MAYTQAQITALEEAIAAGVLRVSYDGKSVEYRSLKEMRAILAEMKAESDPAVRVPRTHLASYSSD